MHMFFHVAMCKHVCTIVRVSYRIFLVGVENFVGHCHSVMHEYENTCIQILKFSWGEGGLKLGGEGNSRTPLCMKPIIVTMVLPSFIEL